MAAAGTRVPVHLLGVGAVGGEADTSTVTQGRTIPWLQDTTTQDAWGAWRVNYRDLVVLDAANRPITIYNLTSHDLTRPTARDTLIQILTTAAQ